MGERRDRHESHFVYLLSFFSCICSLLVSLPVRALNDCFWHAEIKQACQLKDQVAPLQGLRFDSLLVFCQAILWYMSSFFRHQISYFISYYQILLFHDCHYCIYHSFHDESDTPENLCNPSTNDELSQVQWWCHTNMPKMAPTENKLKIKLSKSSHYQPLPNQLLRIVFLTKS